MQTSVRQYALIL